MSTAIQTYRPDAFGRHVAQGVVENAFFSAFYNLITQRRDEGYTKAIIAERMGIDRAAVTKLTSSPTNMKISTISSMANALDADIVMVLVDRSHRGRIFTSIGTHISRNNSRNVAFNSGVLSLPMTNVGVPFAVNTANNTLHSTLTPRT